MTGIVNASDTQEVIAGLREQGVDTMILGAADTHGIMRGKRVPLTELGRLLDHGLAFCNVFWVMHVDESGLVMRPDDHTGYFPTERDGYPDIIGVPDPETLRLVPWHPGTAFMLCDWRLPDGEPVPIAPRQVLERVVGRARRMGFEPYCGLELEFYLLRETSASLMTRRAADLVPLAERPSTYGVALASRHEPIGRRIREQLLASGLPIEACIPETGPGQFEITLRYRPAIEAADDAFLLKTAIKEIAAQDGLIATFMAKPNPEWAGNSCHVHSSLSDDKSRPVFYDPSVDDGFSVTMRHYLGGTLARMAELTAVMAPTINSYRRYSEYSWAGTTATWAVDNRSTGVRAIGEGEHGTRVEQRQAGGDVNPYLAAAAALAAGLSGVEDATEPPEPTDADVYALPSGAVPALPSTLTDATAALERSDMAREWLGADFVGHYVAMKRAELKAHASAVTDWEIARYLEAL